MSLYIPNLATDDPVSFVQGLADNFILLEDSLVEYGSNENGEYWRWPDGLQVCIRNESEYDPDGGARNSFAFPATFAGHVYGAGGTFGLDTTVAINAALWQNAYIAAFTRWWVLFNPDQASGILNSIRFFAIGPWK